MVELRIVCTGMVRQQRDAVQADKCWMFNWSRKGGWEMDNQPEMKYYKETDKPFYKKIPVVGVIILLLLIGAWAFRWDYKITETCNDNYSDGKVVHKVDRWTGHHWYELYGSFKSGLDWKMYSGAEVACLRSGEVANDKQYKIIRYMRTGTTVIWYIAFFGTLGFVILRVVGE